MCIERQSGGGLRLEDLPDDDDFCRWCEARLPIDRHSAYRKYCSRRCYLNHLIAIVKKDRAEARKGRICDWCSGPIPEGRRNGSRFCCLQCSKKSSRAPMAEERRQLRIGRTCANCAGPIPESKYADAIHCSRKCARRRRYRRKRAER